MAARLGIKTPKTVAKYMATMAQCGLLELFKEKTEKGVAIYDLAEASKVVKIRSIIDTY